MSKPTFIISSAFNTYSGYGARARGIINAIINTGKYNVKLLPQRWGNTPEGFCEDHSEWNFLLKYQITQPEIKEKPEIWLQHTIPNEFQPMGRYNIGVTAGIESTLCKPEWIEGLNKMDLNIVSSEFAKKVFLNSKFQKQDKTTNKVIGKVELNKPIKVLFEGINKDLFYSKPSKNIDLEQIKESFNFLFVGHWLSGNLGHDRKNVKLLIKSFLETFKNQSKKPGLILKTSLGNSSYISRNKILKQIEHIRDTVNSKNLPNIYLFNGDLSDEEVNQLYNHPKVKSMISLTKGEGFGRPLLEFSFVSKPIITTNFSGHTDFLNKEHTTLLPGELENVHPSASNDWLMQEAQWFKVNTGGVGKSLKDVFKNYKKYILKAKKQGFENRNKFNWLKMSEKLDDILEDNLPDFPDKVEINLPDLTNLK